VSGSLNTVIMQCLSSGSREEGAMQKAEPQPWTSGEQNLGFSGTCLEESHGLWSWTEERSRRVAGFSEIGSFKLKNGSS